MDQESDQLLSDINEIILKELESCEVTKSSGATKPMRVIDQPLLHLVHHHYQWFVDKVNLH